MRSILFVAVIVASLAGCVTETPDRDAPIDSTTQSPPEARGTTGSVSLDDIALRACTPAGSSGVGSYSNPVIEAGYRANDESFSMKLEWDGLETQWVAAEIFGSDPTRPIATYWGNDGIHVEFSQEELHALPQAFKIIVRGHADSCPDAVPVLVSTARELPVDYVLNWNL